MTECSTAGVAWDALNLGKQNARDIEAHEDLCAERYNHINVSIGEIKGILKWAGGAAFGIIIGLLAFLAQAQFAANDAAQKAAREKIEMLESAARDRAPQ